MPFRIANSTRAIINLHLFFSLSLSLSPAGPLNIAAVAQHRSPMATTIAPPLDHFAVIDVDPKSRFEEMKKIERDVKANGQGLTILVFKLYAQFIGE